MKTVQVSLVGASTYATMTQIFTRGTPYVIPQQQWDVLQPEVHPVTGATMFCLTSEIESSKEKEADLVEVGLVDSGELDTGQTIIYLNGADENTPDLPEKDGSDLSDLDDPETDATAAQATTQPETPVVVEDASKDATAASTGSRKLILGGKKAADEAVQV